MPKLRSYASMGYVEMKDWNAEGNPTIGFWKPQMLEKTVSQRTYVSNYTPYKIITDAPYNLTHNGTYLQIRAGKVKFYFHRQLYQDFHPNWKSEFKKLHVHHKPQNGVPKSDWPCNNFLCNLEGMEEPTHLREHASEGGRPLGTKRKRPW